MVRLASIAKRRDMAELIMRRFRQEFPQPQFGLTFNTPFQLLISVVLSAKNTDSVVNRVMKPQYEQGFTPQTVLELGSEGFLAKIREIGLAPTKAKNVYRISQLLTQLYDSQVPSTREQLESLPRVGRKTANVVLGEIFGQPILAVDTHVFRVTRRLGLHDEATPDRAEQDLLKIIDSQYLLGDHRYFIQHGRAICKALKPLCDECVFKGVCPSYRILHGAYFVTKT